MVKNQADAIVEQGLDKLGYKYVSLDDCWSAKTRDADGNLQPESKQFPNGMKALADYVHSKGLYFGLYTCVGEKTCKGDRPGSYNSYEQDAKTLASWGVDLIKMDHCGLPSTNNETDQELYGRMSRAMNQTGRPMLFSLCSWGTHNVWEWGGDVGQMFRIQQDHLPLWSFPFPEDDQGGYGAGTKEIIEWMAHLQPSKWTAPYSWMDPDFLMTRYLDGVSGMGDIASRTEYTFWAVWSSPLQIATDIRNLKGTKLDILTNPEVIAVNQDVSSTAADRLRNDTKGGQVWARDVSGGDKVVVLYNANGFAKQTIPVSWAELGWNGASVTVRNLWERKDVASNLTDGYSVDVRPREAILLRLRKQ